MPGAIIAGSIAKPSEALARSVPDADAPPAMEADGYADRLVKLIPGEAISLYLSIT